MDKKISLFKSFLAISIIPTLIISCATAGPSAGAGDTKMSYSRLKLMDLDQMTDLLQKKNREYKRTDNPEPLQQGLEICLSRPDEDGSVEKTIAIVRSPLEDADLWEESLENLVDKSIATLKNKDAHSTDQVTAGVVLENILSELKPNFTTQYQSPGFESRIVEKIALADIEMTNSAISERKLNLMRGSASPSAIAQKFLDHRKQFLKIEARKK